MIRRPPRSTLDRSSAASDVYKRQVISKEKETQYQYLQKILELVDTGILSYQEEDGAIVWMNESLKKMLQLPYLKTIHSLTKRDPLLYAQIMALKPGESKIGTAHLEKD